MDQDGYHARMARKSRSKELRTQHPSQVLGGGNEKSSPQNAIVQDVLVGNRLSEVRKVSCTISKDGLDGTYTEIPDSANN